MSGKLSLSDLNVGDTAVVAGYTREDAHTTRLMQLGLIPGTRFELRRRAPLGDPVEIRFRGFSLALRPAEADALELRRP